MIDLKKIPSKSGCYLFKDSEGKVIYVGKATKIKNFRGRAAGRWWDAQLVGGGLFVNPSDSLFIGGFL